MKKLTVIILITAMITVVMFGCSKKEKKEPAEETPAEIEEPAEPVLSRHEWTNAPAGTSAPAGYTEVLDDTILTSLPYRVFQKENTGGSTDYIAYANGIDTDGGIMESGWHDFMRFGNVVFCDAPDGTAVPDGYSPSGTEADGSCERGFMIYEKDDGGSCMIYGSVYDIRTGEVIEHDWFDVYLDTDGTMLQTVIKSMPINPDSDGGTDDIKIISYEEIMEEFAPDRTANGPEEGEEEKTDSEEAEE